MMNDEGRSPMTWSVRYIDRGQRDDQGYIIPRGWWIAGFKEGFEDSMASIHVAQHVAGPAAAASLAAVLAHLLNTLEREGAASSSGETVE